MDGRWLERGFSLLEWEFADKRREKARIVQKISSEEDWAISDRLVNNVRKSEGKKM